MITYEIQIDTIKELYPDIYAELLGFYPKVSFIRPTSLAVVSPGDIALACGSSNAIRMIAAREPSDITIAVVITLVKHSYARVATMQKLPELVFIKGTRKDRMDDALGQYRYLKVELQPRPSWAKFEEVARVGDIARLFNPMITRNP